MDATIDRNEVDQAEPSSILSAPPDLSQLAGFSAEDILDNRNGRLSPTQRQHLGWRVFWELLGPSSLVALAIYGFGRCGFNLFTAALFLLFLIPLYPIFLTIRDVRAGVVAVAEGNASTRFVPDPEGAGDYRLDLGDLHLDITGEACDVIRAGGGYRVFYLPVSKRLVGAEVLPGWQPASLSLNSS